MNSQPSSDSTRSIVLDGGGRTGHHHAHRAPPGYNPALGRRVSAALKDGGDHCCAPHSSVTPMPLDARQDFSSPSTLRSTHRHGPPIPVTA